MKTPPLKVGQEWMSTPWVSTGSHVVITAIAHGWIQYHHYGPEHQADKRALKEDAFRAYYQFPWEQEQ